MINKDSIHLQWTVQLTVAVAGVSTPLLAVHWYWIMLSGVPGLLTFTMVSDDFLESTSELPSLVHVMTGWGLPDALQVNVMLSPSTSLSHILWLVIDGGSKIKSKLKSVNSQKYKSVLYEKFYLGSPSGIQPCRLGYPKVNLSSPNIKKEIKN